MVVFWQNFCGQPTSDNEFVVFGKVTEGWEVIKVEFTQIFAENEKFHEKYSRMTKFIIMELEVQDVVPAPIYSLY